MDRGGEQTRLWSATDADAGALAELRVQAMRPSLEAVGRFDPDRARHRFLSTFRAGDTKTVLLDGVVAGFFVVRRRADHLYLDHLYIAGAFQGRGLGRRCVDDVKSKALALGLPIRLTALKGSPANQFYRACGFAPVSEDALDCLYEWLPHR